MCWVAIKTLTPTWFCSSCCSASPDNQVFWPGAEKLQQGVQCRCLDRLPVLVCIFCCCSWQLAHVSTLPLYLLLHYPDLLTLSTPFMQISGCVPRLFSGLTLCNWGSFSGWQICEKQNMQLHFFVVLSLPWSLWKKRVEPSMLHEHCSYPVYFSGWSMVPDHSWKATGSSRPFSNLVFYLELNWNHSCKASHD